MYNRHRFTTNPHQFITGQRRFITKVPLFTIGQRRFITVGLSLVTIAMATIRAQGRLTATDMCNFKVMVQAQIAATHRFITSDNIATAKSPRYAGFFVGVGVRCGLVQETGRQNT